MYVNMMNNNKSRKIENGPSTWYMFNSKGFPLFTIPASIYFMVVVTVFLESTKEYSSSGKEMQNNFTFTQGKIMEMNSYYITFFSPSAREDPSILHSDGE